jgi:Lrp/AsnC family leucine-responsive transcriptional regulator
MVKRTYKIDDIDVKILNALQDNGRVSNIDLSEMVGISPSPCLRRLKSLQDNGIIKSFSTQLDESFFGLNLIMFASLTIEVKSEEERDNFERELANIIEIKEVYALSLETDYLVKILVNDWIDYKRIINTKVAKLPFIKKIRTTQITRVIKKDSKIVVV